MKQGQRKLDESFVFEEKTDLFKRQKKGFNCWSKFHRHVILTFLIRENFELV